MGLLGFLKEYLVEPFSNLDLPKDSPLLAHPIYTPDPNHTSTQFEAHKRSFTEGFEVPPAPLLEAAGASNKVGRAVSMGYDEEQRYGGYTINGGMSERDRKEALLQAYLHNPWLSAAIESIALRIVSGGVAIEEVEQGKGDQSHLQILQDFFSIINEHWDFKQFFYSVIVDLLVFGESFVEIVWQGNTPVKLYKIDCLTMEYTLAKNGDIAKYTQKLSDNQSQDFDPEDIIRWWFPHPRSNMRALAPAEKLQTQLYCFESMMQCQINLFRRGAKHPYHVDFPTEDPEEAKRQQVYFTENYTGKKNFNTPVYTYGGTTIQDFGKGMIDVDFQKGLDMMRDAVLSVLKVPPANVGVIESGNIGGGTGESQEETFLRNACDPIKLMIFEKITYRLVKAGFGFDDYTVSSRFADYRDKGVVTDIQMKRVQNGMLTINEARAEAGKAPVDGGDTAVLIMRTGAQAVATFSDLETRQNQQNQIDLANSQVSLDTAKVKLQQMQQQLAQGAAAPPSGEQQPGAGEPAGTTPPPKMSSPVMKGVPPPPAANGKADTGRSGKQAQEALIPILYQWREEDASLDEPVVIREDDDRPKGEEEEDFYESGVNLHLPS